MGNREYSVTRGSGQSDSSGPDAEALGTVRSTGRIWSAAPSQPIDALATGGADASTDRFTLTYYDPPARLENYVLTLFHFIWNESDIEDRHPGALPQLFFTPIGKGEIRFGDRTDPLEGSAHAFSGFETAVPFKVHGPWHAIGASLTPLGWAALMKVPANHHINHLIPASELLGNSIDQFAQGITEQYREKTLSGGEACKALGSWIADHLCAIPAAHRLLIERTIAWLGTSLNPDVEMLFASLDYSRRQAERLVARYFGFAPAALARRYRAIRAANLLAQRDLTDEGEAEIASAFYDQPHMIREIRRYCGYTPTRLGGEAEPLFQTMLRLRNLDRLRDFRKIGARD